MNVVIIALIHVLDHFMSRLTSSGSLASKYDCTLACLLLMLIKVPCASEDSAADHNADVSRHFDQEDSGAIDAGWRRPGIEATENVNPPNRIHSAIMD